MEHVATLQNNMFTSSYSRGLHGCHMHESCAVHNFSTTKSSSSSLNSFRCRSLQFSRKARILQCSCFQRSISLDRVNEADNKKWGFESLDIGNGNGRKFRKHLDIDKTMHSSIMLFEGPFISNDEETNKTLLQNLCKQGRLKAAARLVDVMARKNQIPHFPSCSNLVRGFIKLGQMGQACKILQIMIMSGGVPDVITYNMIVGGLCKIGHLRSAIDILGDMSLSGCSPDAITYNTIIRCMFDNGEFEQAINFWKDRLRMGCPPYLITYTVLIDLVCKYCGAARALEVLEDIATEGCCPDIITYNSLINFTCKQGRFEDTALVILSLLSYEMQPNNLMQYFL